MQQKSDQNGDRPVIHTPLLELYPIEPCVKAVQTYFKQDLAPGHETPASLKFWAGPEVSRAWKRYYPIAGYGHITYDLNFSAN